MTEADTARSDSAADLRESLAFETLLSELLTTFLRLPAEAVDDAIEAAQCRVCELFGLNLSTLWQWVEEGSRYLTMTHLYRPLGGPPLPERIDSEELFPWIRGEVLARREVALSSLQALPPEAEQDRESARRLFGTRSTAIFPLAPGGGEPLGAVSFGKARVELVWSEAMLRRLRSVAALFTAAIERKNADEELRGLSRRLIRAHEEERSVLARELHDDVSQRLAVMAIDAGRAELEAHTPEQTERLRTVREGLVRLSEDIHTLSYQLHPSVLEELGLAEALEAECSRFRRRNAGVLTASLVPVPRNIGDDEALCLFRVAQESLNNVARHAAARSVRLTLRPAEGGWILSVRDDGAGFDPAARRRRRSLGLESMRERARIVDGRLEIDSSPGRGTEVVVWVPATGRPA